MLKKVHAGTGEEGLQTFAPFLEKSPYGKNPGR